MTQTRLRAIAALAPGVVTLVICLYQLTLPHALRGVHGYSGLGYDDGVYLGAATRLVHGAAPYKDFVLVHPPGIVLLMAPVAWLGDALGSADALAIARLLTAIVAATNASLAAFCLRHRGYRAMLFAGVAVACFPAAVSADHTLLLEPYLVLFTLIGVALMFDGGRLASDRRLLWAGVAFGFATAVKLWGVLVVVAVLVACIPLWQRAVRPMAIGLAAGFGLPCLPFLLLAPHGFIHQVFGDQVARTTLGAGSLPAGDRLLQLTGLRALTAFDARPGTAMFIAAAFLVFVSLTIGCDLPGIDRLDVLLICAAVVTTIAMFNARDMYDHYAYYPAPVYAMLGARCLARVVDWASARTPWLATPWLPAGLGVALMAFAVPQQVSYARDYLAGAFDPRVALTSVIPEGACVVSDQVTDAIVADRFVASNSSCPDVVDPYGTWLAAYAEHLPPWSGPLPESFVRRWEHWLDEADYVVAVGPRTTIIPWPVDLAAWFDAQFSVAFQQPGLIVYRHTGTAPPP
jgi:hypothetical protein